MVALPVKPIPPKKTKLNIIAFGITIMLFITISYIIVYNVSDDKVNKINMLDFSDYLHLINDQEKEMSKYYSSVYNYIKSINSKYDIDKSGNIPVIATVQIKRDKQSKSIGDELTYNFYINNNKIINRKDFKLNIFQEITFATEIIEEDPSSDDKGRAIESIPISFIDINAGYKLEQEVRVKESYGDYAGNVAIYHVTYTIKPKQVLSLTSSQKSCFPKYPILPNEKDYTLSMWDAVKNYTDIKIYIGILFVVFCFFSYYIFIKKPNLHYKHALEEYNIALEEYNTALKEYTLAKNETIRVLSGKTIREAAGVPDNIYFTDDDLPYTKGDERKFGDFTLFITRSGYCFHRKATCQKNTFPIHMFKIIDQYFPCSKCSKDFLIQKPAWYSEYLDLKRKCIHFDIHEKTR